MRLLVVLVTLVLSVSYAFDCAKYLECADSTVDYIKEVGAARMVQVKRKVVVNSLVVAVTPSIATPTVLLFT